MFIDEFKRLAYEYRMCPASDLAEVEQKMRKLIEWIECTIAEAAFICGEFHMKRERSLTNEHALT